jgi:predicted transposase/invertase (TIGR01784 family)
MPKYINPYTDFGFKKIFGQEANKEPLIDFLNSVLPEKHRIKSLTFRNAENLPLTPIERRVVFDVFCVAETGERFIVEMQKCKEHYYKDRSLYYVTFPIREQAQVGEWDFKLDPVYFIGILNFKFDEATEKQKLQRNVTLKDQDGDEFYDKLQFIFFQMPLFTKTEAELETQKDKWLYFLKNLQSFDDIPKILNEPVFERAFETAELARMNANEQFLYDQQQMALWDNFAALETAKMDGKAEGKTERDIEIARNLITMGLATEAISKATGLSKDEIEQLL